MRASILTTLVVCGLVVPCWAPNRRPFAHILPCESLAHYTNGTITADQHCPMDQVTPATPVVGTSPAPVSLPLVTPASNPNDSDGDGILNPLDNCPATFNPSQLNSNGSAAGDACDAPLQTAACANVQLLGAQCDHSLQFSTAAPPAFQPVLTGFSGDDDGAGCSLIWEKDSAQQHSIK